MAANPPTPFPFSSFEPKWQSYWLEHDTFAAAQPGEPCAEKPPYYVLDMFPYPSGAGLHVGHPEGYTATDIVARYKRMQGFNVLHPMGWDAFGLPAEQYAIKTGQHPRITTEENVANFRRQLQSLGFSYDWKREVNTTDPSYMRWTQWIFLKLFNSYFDPVTQKARPVSELESQGWTSQQIEAVRLAYVHEAPVNWSPDLGTVLANEEVEEWKAKGHRVERRPLRQWMLRITAYAQRLIDDLESLDWPESIKLLQKNWIGKSEGARVSFALEHGGVVEVYTTRPDTLFGATYMVFAPEHPLVADITTEENKEAVASYIERCATKSDMERTELNKEKTGVFTGAYAINPVNGKKLPIWIADYVMMGYGTGAIMAVPAHDERDFDFATVFNLPIIQVVDPLEGEEWQGYAGKGIARHSGFLDGLTTDEAKKAMIQWLEKEGCGHGQVQYKLRDWLFSRQRYWGEPFPIIWEDGSPRGLDEGELPLMQPEMEDFKPTGSPEGPLAKAREWIAYSHNASRETNTMPQWAGSCWYYLRYCDADNREHFISPQAEAYWSQSEKKGASKGMVDLYIGGTEHAVLHLLYARFWHKVLYDLGYLTTCEPFEKLVNQGLILGEDGQKMSKSLGNVVNPDDIVKNYGADSLRLYEMFMGPLEQVKPWQTRGVEGVYRFLARVWRLAFDWQDGEWQLAKRITNEAPHAHKHAAVLKALHLTIQKVGEDIESLSFNTAIAQMMVCVNTLRTQESIPAECLRDFLKCLNPFAPHITEEIHEKLTMQCATARCSRGRILADRAWPSYNEKYLVEDQIEVVVQVNGKLRARLDVAADISKENLEKEALSHERIAACLEGKQIVKVIVVPGRLVNIVARAS